MPNRSSFKRLDGAGRVFFRENEKECQDTRQPTRNDHERQGRSAAQAINLVEACLLVVSFEAFEPRNHNFARGKPIPVLAWESERRENLDKSCLCRRCLSRIPSGDND
jgi:hypothetical protein